MKYWRFLTQNNVHLFCLLARVTVLISVKAPQFNTAAIAPSGTEYFRLSGAKQCCKLCRRNFTAFFDVLS
jgi:hypothetical protein